MRFQVGSIIPFIRVHFNYANGNDALMSNTYLPWDNTLKGIHIFWLKCTEHHKVRNEWDREDAEPKHDGFIFKSQIVGDDRVWHNQYPYASYGQLSDAADWSVTRDVSKEELDEKGLDGISIDYSLTHLPHYLEELLHGEWELRNKHDQVDFADQLKEHYDRVVDMIEKIDGKLTGKKVMSSPHTFKTLDSDEVHSLPGRFRVTIQTFEV
jgi:hypothetical protein